MSYRQNIPKIIHQIWLGPKPRPENWMRTWKEKNPEWEYRLWTEENLPELFNEKQFNAITSYGGKADILRIELLYQFGGIYTDADSECLRPLDALLRYHFFACYENEQVRPGLIANGVIGSEAHHPLLKMLIEEMHVLDIDLINEDKAFVKTGPLFFTKIIRKFGVLNKPVAILPSHIFYPSHYTGSEYKGRGRIYATQYWQTTHEELDAIKTQKMVAAFSKIHEKNLWADPESVSGVGSNLIVTTVIRREIPLLIKELQIKTILDAPCGDFNWMKEMELEIESYTGIDIVSKIIEKNSNLYESSKYHFYQSDISTDPLPKVDLILCRDCLSHFSFEHAKRTLVNFQNSGSHYLLVTNYFNVLQNEEIQSGDWRPINLEKPPFNFPPPLLNMIENCKEANGMYADKALSLWKLN